MSTVRRTSVRQKSGSRPPGPPRTRCTAYYAKRSVRCTVLLAPWHAPWSRKGRAREKGPNPQIRLRYVVTLSSSAIKSPRNRRALVGAVHRPRALCRPPARDPALQDSRAGWYRLLTSAVVISAHASCSLTIIRSRRKATLRRCSLQEKIVQG